VSYSLKILKDSPIGFWQLDDVAVNPTFDFNDILEHFETYQDLLDGYDQYGNINYFAEDSSGCSNVGLYVGEFNTNLKYYPLSPGGQYSIEINSSKSIEFPIINSYYQNNATGGFASVNSADNDFTLECWIHPHINTNSLTTIFADASNNIGIFYQNGNILFKLNNFTVEHTLLDNRKTTHIACTYSVTEARIYIDGELKTTKQIIENPFSNNNLLLKSGPTQNIQDTFLIDDIAVYRYALSEKQIFEHYINEGYTIPSQIVEPDNGELFEFQDTDISKAFSYSYPLDRSWEEVINEDLYYNEKEQYIQIKQTESSDSKTIVIEDTIYLPAAVPLDSSKIEWHGSNGISVETSTDGENYYSCINGESIPQYTKSTFDNSRVLNIKITISSSNSSRYLPRLYSLSINFYNNQIMYSKNGNSYISKIDDSDFYLGSKKYPILSNYSKNGILVPSSSGFNVNLFESKKSIEFFYTPYSLDKSLLISSIADGDGVASEYSWNQNGSINKTNILSIYVNGEDVSSETLISNIFTVDDIHHVVINFTEPIYGLISINYKSSGSTKALYQYMSFYQNNLIFNKIINHYNLYTSRERYQTTGSSISMSENSVSLYNNDWLVIQNS